MTSFHYAFRLSFFFTFLPLHYWCSVTSKPCALYEPPATGLQCLRGVGAEKALNSSRWVWMMEFYSSWCGHCQQFAPQFQKLAVELQQWSEIVRVGVLECSESIENQDACRRFGVQAYPTIKVSEVQTHPLAYSQTSMSAVCF